MTAVVIGGGMSGAACAVALAHAGVEVEIRERSRVLGGRMASRTLRDTGTAWDGRVVDIGASYFTAADEDFRLVVDGLVDQGVVRPWTDAFHVAGPSGIEAVTSGPLRYAAPRGLRSVVAALAEQSGEVLVRIEDPVERIESRGSSVVVDGVPVAAVGVCMPLPQAARISDDVPDDTVTWEPVIAVTCVFADQTWIDLDGVFVNDDPVLTWIADDGSRRGDGAPVLVAHVHPVLSARHLDDPQAVIPAAVATLQRVLGVTALPEWVDAHRWTFAKPTEGRAEAHWLHDQLPLGVAGDAWAGGTRVEAAWLSGRSLGRALAVRASG
jgi:renalase